MYKGLEQNNASRQDKTQFALLRELEKEDHILLAIDLKKTIFFKRKEADQLLEKNASSLDYADFLDEDLELSVTKLIEGNTSKRVVSKQFLLEPLFFQEEKVAVAVKTNSFLQRNWRTFLKLSKVLRGDPSVVSLAENFAGVIKKRFEVNSVFLALFDKQRGQYSFPHYSDEKCERQCIADHIQEGSFTNFVRISGKPLLMQQNEIAKYSSNYNIVLLGEQPASLMVVPIKYKGHSVGVFSVRSYAANRLFDREDLRFLEEACGYLADSLFVNELYEKLQKNEELLSITNSISKIFPFEYSCSTHSFLPTGKLSEALKLKDNKASFPFSVFLEEVKAEEKYIAEQGFVEFADERQQFERELKLKDGFTILKIFAFKVEKQGGRTAVLGVVQDVTHIKQNEKILKSAHERAQQADRLKSEFMTVLSYEVRSPINAIIGFSNLMVNEGLTTDERKSYHRIVRQNGHTLIKIIDEVVDVSRLESGEVKIHKNPTDINRLLNNILVFSKTKLIDERKQNIEIALHRNHNQMIIMTDESRLLQVLQTLVTNAITYTEQGYIQFGYHIIEREQPLIEFFVKDTGSGIPDSKKDLLFQRYGRLDGNRVIRPGVTSVGLSISKDLVRLMGGEMTVESKETQGTTFYFYLPYERAIGFEQKEPPAKHLFLGQTDTPKVCILVAEDNVSNYRLIEESFAKANYQAEFAFTANGFEAIEKLRLEHFDILLMDLKMPLMDGMKTAEYIRKKLPKPKNKIPLVALTANAMQETRRACLENGFNGFIPKPFLPEDLVKKVAEILGL